MKNSKKRGFTIVELVIVIAVIAILAGVLIPTFVSVINKANESTDTALIKYLNTSLKSGSVGQEQPKTMQGALDIVEADGYNVAKIKATASGARILWDSKNNCFVYLKEGETEPTYIPDSKTQNVANVDYWQITEADEDLSNKYSNYLALGYTKDLTNVQTGLDVGQNNNLTNVVLNSNSDKELVVRTNSSSTTLDVNAPNAVVKHYDLVGEVNVARVAMSSYHEFGVVYGDINLASGNVEVENGASVNNIVVKELQYTDGNSTQTVTPSADKLTVKIAERASLNSISTKIDGIVIDNIVSGTGKDQVAVIEANNTSEAYIGKTGYATLAAAVAAVQSGNESATTITLAKNVSVASKLVIAGGKNLVLNLNGNNIESKTYFVLSIFNSKVSIIGAGTIFENIVDGYAPIEAKGSSTDVKDYTVITIGENVTLKGDYSGIFVATDVNGSYKNYGLVINMHGTIDMSAVSDGKHYCGIYINGQNKVTTGNVAQFNLDGARLIGMKNQAIYGAGYAKWNLSNCYFEAGMEFKAGLVNIYSGTYAGTGNESHVPNGNGSSTSGYCLAVVRNKGYSDVLSVTIHGGNFTGGVALFADNIVTSKAILTVKGGTFQEGKLFGLINDGFADNINVFNDER